MNVFITGINSGIGLATAELLNKQGYNVIGSVRLSALGERPIDGVKYVVMDLESEEGVRKGWQKVQELADGPISYMFLNAGFGIPSSVEDLTWELLQKQFSCNVFAQQALMKLFIQSLGHDSKGMIVVNSSVLGFYSNPYRGAYCGSKHALEGLCGALSAELMRIESNIKVAMVQPGPIRTNFRSRCLKEFDAISKSTVYEADYVAVRNRLASNKWGSTSLSAEAVAIKILEIIQGEKSGYVKMNIGTYLARLVKRVFSDKQIIQISSLGAP